LSENAASELISQTPNARMVTVAETAFSLNSNVSVDYKNGAVAGDPVQLICVSLDLNRPMNDGEVLSLTYDEADATCYALIRDKGKSVEVMTQDERAQ
jgi:hypothetical protein